MRLTKVGDWIKYVTESGKTFYYNQVTNDFQWDDPTGTGHVRSERQRTTADNEAEIIAVNNLDTNYHDNNSSGKKSESSNSRKETAAAGDNNNPWRPYLDAETDTIFWYNSVTQVSQWECPFDNPPTTTAATSSTSPSTVGLSEERSRNNSRRRPSINSSSFDENDGDSTHDAVVLVNHEADLDLW